MREHLVDSSFRRRERSTSDASLCSSESILVISLNFSSCMFLVIRNFDRMTQCALQEIAPVNIDTDSSLADDVPPSSHVRTIKTQDAGQTRKRSGDVMIRRSLEKLVRDAQEELNEV